MKLFTLILLAPLVAMAAPAKDVALCNGMDPAVDRKACLLEQRNARAEAKKGQLATDKADLEKNRLARCQAFKNEADQLSCRERVAKGAVTGTVQTGATVTTYKDVVMETKK